MTRIVEGYRRGRREGVEVLTEGVGCDGFVVGGDKLVEFDGEKI